MDNLLALQSHLAKTCLKQKKRVCQIGKKGKLSLARKASLGQMEGVVIRTCGRLRHI